MSIEDIIHSNILKKLPPREQNEIIYTYLYKIARYLLTFIKSFYLVFISFSDLSKLQKLKLELNHKLGFLEDKNEPEEIGATKFEDG